MCTNLQRRKSGRAMALADVVDFRGLAAGSGSWENIQEVIRTAFREVFAALTRLESAPGVTGGSPTPGRPATHIGADVARVLQEQDAAIRARDVLLASLSHDVATLSLAMDSMQRAGCGPSTAMPAAHPVAVPPSLPSHAPTPVIAPAATDHGACDCVRQLADFRSDVARALATKADAGDVSEALAAKASKASVLAALQRKASKDKTTDSIDRVVQRLRAVEEEQRQQQRGSLEGQRRRPRGGSQPRERSFPSERELDSHAHCREDILAMEARLMSALRAGGSLS